MNWKSRSWLAILLFAIIVRLLTLGAYPLHDTTEARYAEVARLMLVSGDWITPQISAGTPFWAKPPLSVWATAGSYALFGVNEFAARLPALLFALFTAALVYRLGRARLPGDSAIAASAIFLTTGVGFVCAGAVMTDAALLFATTLAMVGFWLGACEQDQRWAYIFFVALGIGLLAKGPVALVLVGIPMLIWSFYYRGPAWLLESLPWVSGTALTLAITAPWYLVAEARTPGFLEYFFIGEHWLRFIDSGWQGDLYGNAHARPRGTIWAFAVAGGLPWSVIAFYAGFKSLQALPSVRSLSPFTAFLLLWMAAPLLLFTVAANILPSYVLPGVPAFALLLGTWFSDRRNSMHNLGWLMPIVISAVFLSDSFGLINQKTQRELVALHAQTAPDVPLYFFPNVPYSASFYSNGSATLVPDEDALRRLVRAPGPIYIAVRERRFGKLDPETTRCMQAEAWIRKFVLVRAGRSTCRRWNRVGLQGATAD